MNPQIDFLYSFENPQLYQKSCDDIFAKYGPEGSSEQHLVSHIAVAVWLRRRAACVMHAILRELQELQARPSGSPTQVVQLTRSLVRFNREYRHHKKHISGCRAELKRLRLQGGQIASDAKVLEFPALLKETYPNDFGNAQRAA